MAVRAALQSQESAADLAAINIANASPRRYAEMLVRASVLTQLSCFNRQEACRLLVRIAAFKTGLKDMRHFNTKPTSRELLSLAVITAATLAATPAYRLGHVDPSPKAFGFACTSVPCGTGRAGCRVSTVGGLGAQAKVAKLVRSPSIDFTSTWWATRHLHPEVIRVEPRDGAGWSLRPIFHRSFRERFSE